MIVKQTNNSITKLLSIKDAKKTNRYNFMRGLAKNTFFKSVERETKAIIIIENLDDPFIGFIDYNDKTKFKALYNCLCKLIETIKNDDRVIKCIITASLPFNEFGFANSSLMKYFAISDAEVNRLLFGDEMKDNFTEDQRVLKEKVNIWYGGQKLVASDGEAFYNAFSINQLNGKKKFSNYW